MIGSIISAGMKVAGSIAGGIMGAKTAKENKKILDQQKRDNQSWYNLRYNEDGTQRADAQRLLTNTKEQMRNMVKSAQGANAVTGASTEAIAAQKAANNQALANATSQIAAASDARKDNIEAQYINTKSNLAQQGIQNNNAKMQAINGAISGISSAADVIGGIDKLGQKSGIDKSGIKSANDGE